MLEGCEMESGTSGKVFLIYQQWRRAFFPTPHILSVSSRIRAVGDRQAPHLHGRYWEMGCWAADEGGPAASLSALYPHKHTNIPSSQCSAPRFAAAPTGIV